ncbi:hypothetical protein ACK8P5_25795 (plasmid) [Paenibacillus sp. EC2-1]|uniref:hypothetical protein n=1 Tax=Paenibacillus sp. EC2-1 TaxID=3388665 RepID=UPI003BEECBE6
MANNFFNAIRGSQIKDGAIKDVHLAADAAISESKLAIDWETRGNEILSKKLVVDFVQVDNVAITASSVSVNLTAKVSGSPATADGELGPIVQTGKNKVILRNSTTGDPIIGEAGREVYGRLTHDEADYIVKFYSLDAIDGEVEHTFADVSEIDLQFPQRFTFKDVVETFAANEKFVDGASDISSRLDLTQLAKDIFGSSYQYDHDGVANNVKTVLEMIAEETKAREDADEALGLRIDAIVKPYSEDKAIGTGDALIGKTRYTLSSPEGFVVGAKTLSVYLNGMLQMIGRNYTEVADESVATKGVAIEMMAPFEDGDVFQLRWFK